LFLKSDQGTRVRRWAYNGFHSLDPQFLLRRGLAWDATIWIVSLAGLALSVTGCVVAWQWLRKSGWLYARTRPARHTERPPKDELAGAVRRHRALNS